MRIQSKNVVMQFKDNRPLRIQDACGIEIQCLEGVVWLTIEGIFEDYLLAQGEHKWVEGHGLVLVQGMPTGVVQLSRRAIGSIQQCSRDTRIPELRIAHRFSLQSI